MTLILSNRHLKFKINENDHNPPHVHVEGGGASIRINLLTLEPMDDKTEFSPSTVKRIIKFVSENKRLFLDEWEIRHGQDY